ncbi:MAG: glycosyl hydrolase-related protein [Chloroflexota bacterium]
MRTLHLVSHTHWDREWYLPYQEFRMKLVHLVDHLLDLLQDDHHYMYYMLDGQTIILNDYLEIRPEREELLRQYTRNGRLVIGPWYILPDEFLVSPEATIRNILQGERTCRRFGPRMRIGYLPDTFGHIGQMPQILLGFGIHSAVLRRGLDDEPVELRWEAPNGSSVFTAYLRDGYDNAAGLPTSDPDQFITEVRRLRDSLLPHAATPHILLMQGSDHMEPPADTSQAIANAIGKLDGDDLSHSTLINYITAVQACLKSREMPVVRGELRSPKRHHLLPGVLSTRIWIKQRNHACENLLEKWAEPFSAFAELVGVRQSKDTQPLTWITRFYSATRIQNPSPILRHAWRILMENHPHDSICGCSADQTHKEMVPRFDQVEQIGEEITRQSLVALADEVNTKLSPQSDLGAIIVFNSSSGPRTDRVEVDLNLPPYVTGFEIIDHKGSKVEYQTLGEETSELINVTLDRDSLVSIIGGVHDGRVANLSVQELNIERRGDQIYVDAVMAKDAVPNKDAWKKGLLAIGTYSQDRTVSDFIIRARNASTTKIAFVGSGVPGYGWRTFYIVPKPAPENPPRLGPLARLLMPIGIKVTKWMPGSRFKDRTEAKPSRSRYAQIENEFFKIEAAPDGTLTVTDKNTGSVYHSLNRLEDNGDCGDEYNTCAPARDQTKTAKLKRARAIHHPVASTLELDLDLVTAVGLSTDRRSRSRKTTSISIQSSISVFPGVRRIDIRTTVNNTARDHRLRVHFPAPLSCDHAFHDGHFEIVRRPTTLPAYDDTWVEDPRPEVPQRVFSTITDGKLGLTIANRGLPEVEALKTKQGCEVALTLLRCVGWLSRDDIPVRKGHAGPHLETPDAQMLGTWNFDYSIIPHDGNWKNANQDAYWFDNPMRAVGTGMHKGILPLQGSFIDVRSEDFIVSAIKHAEEGRGWVVRGYNPTDEEDAVTLKPWRIFDRVERINLEEDKIDSIPIDVDGSITTQVRGHEIATFLFSD